MSDEHRDDLVETAQRYLPGGSSWMWTLPRALMDRLVRNEPCVAATTAIAPARV
jgi:hypothetical protein